MKRYSSYLVLLIALVFNFTFAADAFAKSGGGGGCFLPDSRILKADGTETPICTAKPGDKLLAFTEDHKPVITEVREVYRTEVSEYVLLKTDRANLKVTKTHPFYTSSGNFETLESLKPGDKIMAWNGKELVEQKILSMVRIDQQVEVFNLETESPNTFFAGTLAVHNKGGSSGGGGRAGGSVSGGGKSSSGSSGGSSWGGKSTGSAPTTAKAPTNQAGSWGAKTGSSSTPSMPSSNRATIMTSQKVANAKSQAVATKEYTKTKGPADWSSSRTGYSSGKTAYTPQVATVYQSPASRTVVYNRYYNSGPGGYAYSDPFNHNMIFMFSTMWWFHHWNTVDRELYKDDARIKELEKEVEKLKAQGLKPDPKYKDPGMDEGVMYSDSYLSAVKEGTISEASYAVDLDGAEPEVEKEKSWYSCFISSLFD